MRLRSSLFQLLAIGQGGAIMEQGDGELLLPPVLQPVATIGSPLFGLAAVPVPLRQSNHNWFHQLVSGVAGAVTDDTATLGAGIWDINLHWTWRFTGTNDITKQAQIVLVDPDGNIDEFFAQAFITGAQVIGRRRFTLSLSRDNWIIRTTHAATIAGDVADLHVSILSNKLT